MPFFILEDALYVWTNLGKHLRFVWSFVSSPSSSRRMMRPIVLNDHFFNVRENEEENASFCFTVLVSCAAIRTNDTMIHIMDQRIQLCIVCCSLSEPMCLPLMCHNYAITISLNPHHLHVKQGRPPTDFLVILQVNNKKDL